MKRRHQSRGLTWFAAISATWAADAAPVDQMVRAALAKNRDLPGMWLDIWDPAKGVHMQAYGVAA
jgi:hypothetical protein